ncbi:hypothetical protein CTI18_06555 [Prevotella intermedia]|uniref:Capsule assembly Wzi family protein n=2 Tax=Prevotella intermedia TaxID=28131 RepID=A0A2G8IBX3_PREIN|nr:capsule assembly Wzi family protein [Prevotella intermedia]PIK21005.1 hypothetical protein CTI18_06555 [Prevotella intermedia]
MVMKRILSILCGILACMASYAQYVPPVMKDTTKARAFKNIDYKVEMQGSFSNTKTPLWLNANKHGLSSLEATNGYIRTAINRPLSVDEERKWGIGYGLDVAFSVNYTSPAVVQQAYIEGRWHHGTLTIGAKEQPMELKNNSLSSGSQTLGINARPVPQVRLALPDYWTLPFANGWLHLKGHIAYGKMTDDNWQHDFTKKQNKYADNVLYHSKAGYLKLGNEEVFCPWSLEVGLEMVSTFGGTAYRTTADGKMEVLKGETGVKAFWKAFIPGGADIGETTYQNAEGNQLGSWVARLKYEGEMNSYSLYADKYFEDHSGMFFLDYDGYGTGDEWQQKKKHRYLTYGMKDWLLGFEYHRRADSWLNSVVLEYVYSKYQSGPIYHDHTKSIADHIGGQDNYYNHYIYTGYQHWGQTMGNPLYRSPIYNENGKIEFANNRFVAYHLGLAGKPNAFFDWRFLASWQEGLGTYLEPYAKERHNVSLLAEATYKLHSVTLRWLNGIDVKAAYGVDFGSILGGINYGFQFTITKTGLFNL